MKRICWGLGGVLLVVIGLAYGFRAELTLSAIERLAAARMGQDLRLSLPDGLHIAFCGAGSPLPDPDRSGPSVALVAGDHFYLIDSGTNSPRILAQMGFNAADLDGVLLTHFHSDHIDGLGELEMQHWANGDHEEPLAIYGPPGVEEIVEGINIAYGSSRRSRNAHHGSEIVPLSTAGGRALPFEMPEGEEGIVVIDNGDLKITAVLVDHRPVEPAVGYRIDYKGRSAVISGDTVKSSSLQKHAEDVDVLVHEGLDAKVVSRMSRAAGGLGNRRIMKITKDILDYHTTPVEAAEIARDANVGHLVYYHIVPPMLVSTMEAVFLMGVDEVFDGPVTLSRDGTIISLEVGSDRIEVDELL